MPALTPPIVGSIARSSLSRQAVGIAAAYNDHGTVTFNNVSLPASTTAVCPGGAVTTAMFSGTYVLTPEVKDAS